MRGCADFKCANLGYADQNPGNPLICLTAKPSWAPFKIITIVKSHGSDENKCADQILDNPLNSQFLVQTNQCADQNKGNPLILSIMVQTMNQ